MIWRGSKVAYSKISRCVVKYFLAIVQIYNAKAVCDLVTFSAFRKFTCLV